MEPAGSGRSSGGVQQRDNDGEGRNVVTNHLPDAGLALRYLAGHEVVVLIADLRAKGNREHSAGSTARTRLFLQLVSCLRVAGT